MVVLSVGCCRELLQWWRFESGGLLDLAGFRTWRFWISVRPTYIYHTTATTSFLQPFILFVYFSLCLLFLFISVPIYIYQRISPVMNILLLFQCIKQSPKPTKELRVPSSPFRQENVREGLRSAFIKVSLLFPSSLCCLSVYPSSGKNGFEGEITALRMHAWLLISPSSRISSLHESICQILSSTP